MKAVVLDGFAFSGGDVDLSPITSLCEVIYYDRTLDTLAAARIGDAELVFVNKVPLTQAVLEACPRLRYIGVLATGYNVVDVACAARRGICVTNIPAYSTDAVAQQVFAYILHAYSAVEAQSRSVHAGDWTACEHFCYFPCPTYELAGRTIGIVGFGSIGRRVAALAQAFSMRVQVYTRTPRPTKGVAFVSFETLMRTSDVVTVHCPLFPETEKLINAQSLSWMRPTAMLVNTARGGVVDAQALADALNRGQIACAAVDVLAEEPPAPDDPLLTAKNCIITPHTAWSPQQTRQRCIDLAGENLRAFLNGAPQNQVTT